MDDARHPVRLDCTDAAAVDLHLSGDRGAAMKTMRTPLGRVRGLGSAKAGTEDFWRQRLTAMANIPLVIAGVVIVVSLVGRNHAAAAQILGSPLIAILMLLFILSVT